MRLGVLVDALVVGGAIALLASSGPFASTQLVDVPSVALCVTSGHVAKQGNVLSIDDKSMRAVVNDDHSSEAELQFRYAGPAKRLEPLANGELRMQIGLKLRAKDTCNVVYVMWHIAPDQGVAVSIKSNPKKSTHGECGATGYINEKPTVARTAPPIAPGSTHVLHAVIDHSTLRVHADGILVWEGDLGDAAFAFDGPAGVRTDNVETSFVLRVPQRGKPWRGCPLF